MRLSLFPIATLFLLVAATPGALTPERKIAIEQITAGELRGHVSFLASDELEGRDTPSKGLDVAAEYIASRFRALALEPAAGDSYFQIAEFKQFEMDSRDTSLLVSDGTRLIALPSEGIRLQSATSVELIGVPVAKASFDDPPSYSAEALRTLAGKVMAVDGAGMTVDAQRPMYLAIYRARPAAILLVHSRPPTRNPIVRRVRDPQSNRPSPIPTGPPFVNVHNAEFHKLFSSLPNGATPWTATLRTPEALETSVKLRNVAGILRGTVSGEAAEYIAVSAHYDHVGVGTPIDGDAIYNGANDDASGVATILETAQAMTAKERPKRSVLFIAWFGEELGLYGSRYYMRNPLVPLKSTVANINLEQVGRYDGPGAAPDAAFMTGYTYSDIHKTLEEAGNATGVRFVNDEKNGDAFFDRSDNVSFAEAGIPAHTIGTSWMFPDYHRPGDHWDKLDYPTMEKMVRTIALGVMMLADAPAPPQWNEANQNTRRYMDARSK